MCFPLTSCSEGKTITISRFLSLLRCPSCLAPGLKGSPGPTESEVFCQRVSVAHLVTSSIHFVDLFSLLHCSHFVDHNVTFEWLVGLIHAVTRSILDHSCYIHLVHTLHHPLLCLFLGPVEIFKKTLLSLTSKSNKYNHCLSFSIADQTVLQPSFFCSFLCSVWDKVLGWEHTVVLSRGNPPDCCSLPSDNQWKYPLASSRWPVLLGNPVLYLFPSWLSV